MCGPYRAVPIRYVPPHSSRHAVTLVDVGKRVVAAERITVDDALDQAANVQEADFVPQEVRNGGLVRTVGGAGSQTTLADSLFAGFEAAEGLVIRRCNAQLGQRGEVQLRHGLGSARARSAQYWMGMRMSGTPSCAMIE